MPRSVTALLRSVSSTLTDVQRDLHAAINRIDLANRQHRAQQHRVAPPTRARAPVRRLKWRHLGRRALPDTLDTAWWGVQRCPYEKCPRCEKVFERNPTKRRIHYAEEHYEALYTKGRFPHLPPAERWLAQMLGPAGGERRYCNHRCNEHFFDSRVQLLGHLMMMHKGIFKSLKREYRRRARIAGRPIDRAVRNYFRAH